MSSLTSLGVNKNKAKFAPKANRNKVRKRPQADAAAATEESSQKERGGGEISIEQVKPETFSQPRALSPPPPPPITQKEPTIIAEASSPSTPVPESPIPTPIIHSSSKKESSIKKKESSSIRKESSSKKSSSKKDASTKKPTKKPSGVSLSGPSKGTSFAAPSRSGGASITVGEPRKNIDKENKDDKDEDVETTGRKTKKRRLEDLRPEELKTLDDIESDPARLEDLDKPMTLFTKDMDGIVSKNFREMEKSRYAQKDKMEAMKKMSKEEVEKLKEKEALEEERKKLQLEKEKEERERSRQEKEDGVIEESNHALQVRIVDGEIVLDMDSLMVERPQGTGALEEGSMEVVEESAMSKKVNSRTYGKQTQTKRWSKLETEEFYEAVSQFGTDFEMMAKILPGRTRNMVRSKFNKEEKVNPERITEYLIRKRKPMDLERYKAMTGIELDEVPHDFHEMEIA